MLVKDLSHICIHMTCSGVYQVYLKQPFVPVGSYKEESVAAAVAEACNRLVHSRQVEKKLSIIEGIDSKNVVIIGGRIDRTGKGI